MRTLDVVGHERRRARRFAIRGLALVFHDEGVSYGQLVDVSRGGALLQMLGPRRTIAISDVFFLRTRADVELDLGWARARTVRVRELDANAWQIAVEFQRVEETLRVAIDRAGQTSSRSPGRETHR